MSRHKCWVENRFSDRGQLEFQEVAVNYGKIQIDWLKGWHNDERAVVYPQETPL